MKGLLIGFFQVLCVLQVFGAVQIPANLTNESNSTSSYHKIHSSNNDQFVIGTHKLNTTFNTNSSLPTEETAFIFENIEEETEEFSDQKQVENKLYFAGIPVDQSLDYLYGHSKNNLTFYERLSVIVSNKRHVIFQVFRI